MNTKDKLMEKIIDIFGIDKERWLFCSDADLKENGYWMEKDPYDCACCIAKDEDGWLKKNCHCICHKRINRLAKAILALLISEVERERQINKKAHQWVVGTDTGISSNTIWAVMMGVKVGWAGTPSDDDDYGRCIRLLQLIPEWIDRLDEVTAQYPYWKEHIEHIRKALSELKGGEK